MQYVSTELLITSSLRGSPYTVHRKKIAMAYSTLPTYHAIITATKNIRGGVVGRRALLLSTRFGIRVVSIGGGGGTRYITFK
jgi:hypothetical protein